MNNILFKSIQKFPLTGFEILKNESIKEGFNFLVRLEKEWLNNVNRFSNTGEALYGAYCKGDLVGIGGINIDPYAGNPSIGRIRRFYVRKDFRRMKIGKELLKKIIQDHHSYFNELHLFTDQEDAKVFYESCGFKKYEGKQKLSHKFVVR